MCGIPGGKEYSGNGASSVTVLRDLPVPVFHILRDCSVNFHSLLTLEDFKAGVCVVGEGVGRNKIVPCFKCCPCFTENFFGFS